MHGVYVHVPGHIQVFSHQVVSLQVLLKERRLTRAFYGEWLRVRSSLLRMQSHLHSQATNALWMQDFFLLLIFFRVLRVSSYLWGTLAYYTNTRVKKEILRLAPRIFFHRVDMCLSEYSIRGPRGGGRRGVEETRKKIELKWSVGHRKIGRTREKDSPRRKCIFSYYTILSPFLSTFFHFSHKIKKTKM